LPNGGSKCGAHCWLNLAARYILAGLVIALLGTASAQAREATAIVRVRLLVPRGLDTTAASVHVRAIDPEGRLSSQTLTGSGFVTFGGLAAATYRVTVDLPGAAAGALDLRVETGEIVSIDASLAAAGGGVSVLTVVDRFRNGQGTDLRTPYLRNLPGNDNVWSLIETAAPFLISDRVDAGGLGVARSGLVGVRGASWTSMSLAFGDVDVRHPDRGGALPIAPDLNAVEAVSISSGLAPVNISTGGAAITLVPRRPGTIRRGAIQARFAGPRTVSLNARPGAPSIARLDSYKNVGLEYGGPIVGRARAFVSAASTETRHEDRDLPVRLAGRARSLFTHVVANPTPHDEVRVVANVQALTRPFDGRAQFRQRDVAEEATFAQLQATWDRQNVRGMRQLFSLTYQRGSFAPEIGTPAGGTIDRFTDGPMPAPAAASTSGRWELRFELDPPSLHALGVDHSLQFGARLGRSSMSSHVLAAPTVAELVYGLPARVWVNVAPSTGSASHASDLAVYVADRVALAGSLSVSAGVRVDLAAGSAAGAMDGISWSTVSPRTSFRWAPKHLAVIGGYSRYHPQLSLDLLAFGDPGEPWAQVHRWTDANGNRAFEASELGTLIARSGRNREIAAIDSSLRSPYIDEWALGVERRLGRSMLRGTAILRRERALLGSLNTGVPVSSYRELKILDQGENWHGAEDDRLLSIYDRLPGSFGLDRFLLTNPERVDGRYKGVELEWAYSGSRLHMLVGAMAYQTHMMGGNRGFRVAENDQGILGERFESPNAASYSLGSVFFDRSYVLKWSTSYDAPHDLHFGVVGRYMDGQPFSRLVLAPDLAQGPELVPAYRTGRTRFTFLATIDVRLEKGLTLGRRRAAFTLDVFNLTNRSNEFEEDTISGPNFRRTTAVEPPRTLRFGVRFDF
jgi:hypothetical protein